jgi:hypothetical protein
VTPTSAASSKPTSDSISRKRRDATVPATQLAHEPEDSAPAGPGCGFEQQRYRASGLNLVTAAIMLWNTVYLERATQALRDAGKGIDDRLLQYLSPLGWEHINLTGDYVWRQSRKVEDGQYRPLRLNGRA